MKETSNNLSLSGETTFDKSILQSIFQDFNKILIWNLITKIYNVKN